jgi:DNA-binding transcriptional ArsR family regulator
LDQLHIISRKELFDFWDDILIVKQLDSQNFANIMNPTRRRILEVLLYGITEKYPNSSNSSTRHALSANEIRKLLLHGAEKSESIKLSYQNMYFHLQKLEQVGAIKVIGYLVKGKRTTAYYGRIAKTFISATNDELGYASYIRDDVFQELITKLTPHISEISLFEIFKKIERINRPNINLFKKWLQLENPMLRDLPIDYRKLMELFYLIKNVDQEFLDGLQELGELLNIDKSM